MGADWSPKARVKRVARLQLRSAVLKDAVELVSNVSIPAKLSQHVARILDWLQEESARTARRLEKETQTLEAVNATQADTQAADTSTASGLTNGSTRPITFER